MALKRDDATRDLIQVGQFLSERNWLPATSGNLSVRLDDGNILITVSGCHKGELTSDHLMELSATGEVRTSGRRPSAETALHLKLYECFPEVQCVLHTHSPRATVLSMPGVAFTFEGFEIQKAFPGISSHEESWILPVFMNDQNIPRLAAKVASDSRVRDGFLVAGHGLYAWGETVASARRHVEAIEFLLECEHIRRSFGVSS